MKKITIVVVAGLALGLVPPVGAQETEPVGPKLPPKVYELIVREMQAVLAATQDILDGLVRGDHEIVAEKAQAIHDSFILNQEMTDEDRQGLVDAVPEAFVERDRAFHALTARLAEAARAQDRAEERKLFAEVVDACVACHERYATDRFPGLAD